jgi:hypothetical protein
MAVPVAIMIALFVVLLLAVAAYLVRVIFILGHVNDQLGKITFGVRSIEHQTKPVNELTASMNANLGAVADALSVLVDDLSAADDDAA